MDNRILKRVLRRYYITNYQAFWRRFDKYYKEAGFDRLFFTLSFDCDRDQDATASIELARLLNNQNIVPTFAIPGYQILRAKDIYRNLLNYDVKFINHGGSAHTRFINGIYESVNFYDQLTSQKVVEDMIEGHRIIKDILNIEPNGFRAPHFGSFETNKNLNLIHQTAHHLRYQYCSTSTPWHISKWIKRRTEFNIVEYPVSGEYYSPFTIIDSWEHSENKLVAPRITKSYYDAIKVTVENLVKSGIVGHINIYCDPSHVIGSKYFTEALKIFQNHKIKHVTFDDLIGLH